MDVNAIPDNKFTLFLKPIILYIAASNLPIMGVLGFFGWIIMWGARIFTICYCGMCIYDYIITEYRYAQWKKGGFKEEDKNKYRIK